MLLLLFAIIGPVLQLARLLPLDSHLGGPGSIGTAIAALPALVHSDPKTLQQNLTAAQQLLGTDRATAIAKRHPQLLTCSPFRLQTNLAKLQDLLGLSAAAAVAAAADQPVLLLSSPDSLQLRWQQLRQLMRDVPEDLLAKQLRRSPELLLLRPSTIAAKMQCLDALFTHPAGAGGCHMIQQAAVPAAPPLDSAVEQQLQQQEHAENKQQQLASALARLRSAGAARQLHAGQQQQQQPVQYRQWRHWQRQQQRMICHNSNGSSDGGSSGFDVRVQRLVLKVPGLLCLSPSTLHHHVTELQLLLGLQPDDAMLQRIVQLQPGLLTQAPVTLANKLQLLQYLTGRSEQAVQQAVLKCPAVLTLSVANINAKWELLSSCTASCTAWQEQLQRAAPVTLAMALCYSKKRLQRLQYVVQLHMEQGTLGNGSGGSSSKDAQLEACSSTFLSSTASHRSCRRRTAKPAASTRTGAAIDERVRMQQQPQQQGRTQARQQHGLPAVRWRSLVQESDAAFNTRYPGFAAWSVLSG